MFHQTRPLAVFYQPEGCWKVSGLDLTTRGAQAGQVDSSLLVAVSPRLRHRPSHLAWPISRLMSLMRCQIYSTGKTLKKITLISKWVSTETLKWTMKKPWFWKHTLPKNHLASYNSKDSVILPTPLDSKLPPLLTLKAGSIRLLPGGHSEEVICLMYIFNFVYIFVLHLQSCFLYLS